MSEFFRSEIVRENIKELEILQEKIIKNTFNVPFMTVEERRDHVELMRSLLEKQKNLYFRLSLSEDPEAVAMTEQIREAAKELGFNETHTIVEFFSEMEKTLDRLYEISEM